jgi:hypothetical protein
MPEVVRIRWRSEQFGVEAQLPARVMKELHARESGLVAHGGHAVGERGARADLGRPLAPREMPERGMLGAWWAERELPLEKAEARLNRLDEGIDGGQQRHVTSEISRGGLTPEISRDGASRMRRAAPLP